jgi:hypothetical protein
MEHAIDGRCARLVRGGRFRLGLLAIAAIAAGCASVPDPTITPTGMTGERPRSNQFIQPTSEAALGDAGIDTVWAAPNGDTSDKTYQDAIKKCSDEIKAASTDQIQLVPAVEVRACLVRKGWTRVQVKKK